MMTPNKTNPFIHRLIPAATAAGLSLTLSACGVPADPDPNVAPNNVQTQNNTNNATSGNMMAGNNMTSPANNTSNTAQNNTSNTSTNNQTTAPNNTSANQTTPPNNTSMMTICQEGALYVSADVLDGNGDVILEKGCHDYCDINDASACMPAGECVMASDGEVCTQLADPATNQTPNNSAEMCGEDAYYVANDVRNGVGEVVLEKGCHATCAIDNDCAPGGECLETSVGLLCSQLVSETNNTTNNTTTEQNDGQLTDDEIRAFCQGFYDCDSTLFAESYDSVEACELENRSYVDGVLMEVDQNYGTACADVFEAFYESYLNAGMCVGGTFNIDEMTLLEIESAFDSAYATYCQG